MSIDRFTRLYHLYTKRKNNFIRSSIRVCFLVLIIGISSISNKLQAQTCVLPDATITINSVVGTCPSMTVSATISNTGSLLLPAGTYVTLYDANPTAGAANIIGTFQTTAIITPGASATISVSVTLIFNTSIVYAVVNDKGNTARPFNLSSWTSNTGTNECSYTNNISSKTFGCTDTDGDGVADYADLDDDNDGVLDVVENAWCKPLTGNSIIPVGKTYGVTAASFGSYLPAVTAGLDATTCMSPGQVTTLTYDFGKTVKNPIIGFYGVDFAKEEWFDLNDNPVQLRILDASDPTIVSNNILTLSTNPVAGANTAATSAMGRVQVFGNVTGLKVKHTWLLTASNCDNHGFSFIEPTECLDGPNPDTNNDGIINSLDLDSDGDGCFDAVEAGVLTTTSTGKVIGSYGSNGFANSIETGIDNGIYSGSYAYSYAIYNKVNACLDFDSDGVKDIFDLDDDNDGILDDVERSSCSSTPNYTFLNINGTTTGALAYNAVFPVWMKNSFTESLDGYKIIFDNPVSDVAFEFASIYQDDNYGDFTVKLTDGTVLNNIDFDLSRSYAPATAEWSPQPDNTNNFTGNFSRYIGAPFSPGMPYFKTSVPNTGSTQSWGVVHLKDIAGASTVGIAEVSFKIKGGTTASGTGGLAVYASCFFDLDTDKDGIPNRLDLDSDGDGCPDAVEAGTTFVSTSGVASAAKLSTSVIPSPYGNNGFANGLETTVDNGIYKGTYTYSRAIIPTINSCSDSDTDGVADMDDLDDDNDGVLDCAEGTNIPLDFYTPTIFTDRPIDASGYVKYSSSTPVVGQQLSPPAGDAAGNIGVSVSAGVGNKTSYSVTFNNPTSIIIRNNTKLISGYVTGDEYFDFSTSAGNVIALSDPAFDLQVFIGSVWVDVPANYSASTIRWRIKETSILPGSGTFAFTIQNASSFTFYHYNANASNNNGTTLNISRYCVDTDTDNDGIPNRLDLDSDGDGCPDALEAGVSGSLISGAVKNGVYGVVKNTTSKDNAIAAGPYGLNGLADGVETAIESGVVSYTSKYDPYAISANLASCRDTDNDRIIDLLDIDDDNDGVLDAEESPNCFMSSADWNTTDKTLFAKITSELTTLAGYNNFIELTDNDGASSGTKFSTTVAQSQNGKAIFKIEFFSPTQLDALYIQKNDATQIFAATANSLKIQGSNDNSAWIDLTAALGQPAHASYTTVNGARAITNSNKFIVTTGAAKYKYYRITGVLDANILSGTANEFFFEVNNATYQASYFPKADCSNDTDGDGILNHLDLDSDGDGCSDAIEAKSSTTATSVSVFPTGTDTNNNGLLDVYESTTAGVVSYTSVYNPNAISANLAACRDTDADGILDNIDLDDDNDGILDAIESPQCFYTENDYYFGPRPDFLISTELTMVAAQSSPNNLVDGFYASTNYDVRFETTTLTLNALGSGKEIYRFNLQTPVKLEKIYLAYANSNTSFAANTNLILRGSNDGTTWINLSAATTYDNLINSVSATETSSIPGSPQVIYANIFSVTQNAAKYQYYDIFWSSGGGISNAGYANEVFFDVAADFNSSAQPKITCNNDTDGDGILNHQDLDSDGDGCPDAKEAGITASLTAASVINLAGATIASGTATRTIINAIVAGTGSATFGNNGFVNALETSSESGIYSGTYNYNIARNKNINACTDTDGDNVPDILDLDDDNDGVLDQVECPPPGAVSLVPRFDIASGASTTKTITGFPEELWIDVWNIDNNLNLKINNTNITTVSEINFAIGSTYTLPYTNVVQKNGLSLNSPYNVWTYGNTQSRPMIRIKISQFGEVKLFGLDGTQGTGNYQELVLLNAKYNIVPINITGNNTITLSQNNEYPPTFLNAEFNTYNSTGFCDTDGDGVENRLDLDSDNDGCSDAYEAKTTTNTTRDYKFTSTNNAADFGANGFLNSLETVDDNGIYKSNYPYDFAIDARIKSCLDSDGDGVPDIYDLDDDNDGILDAVESPTCFYSLADLAKPVAVSSDLDPYNATGTYDADKSIDGLISTYSAFKAGQYLANQEILKYTANGLIDITSLTLDLDFRAISNDTASKFRFQGSADNVLWDNLNTAAVSSMNYIPPVSLVLTNNLQVGKKYKYFRLYGVSGTSNYGGVANATFNLATTTRVSSYPKLTCTNDTDGDGILNQLDLDSDGDGCPDAKEAGVIGTLTTGTVVNLTTPSGTATSTSTGVANALAAGNYSANGFADALETATESGLYSGTYYYDYAITKLLNGCTDTDGDGVPDLIDIDDDNDGILDAIESPTCFYNATELSQPISISTELLSNSTYVISNAIDGNSATSASFTVNQNWIGKEILKVVAISQIPIASLDIDVPSGWSFSNTVTTNTFKLQGSTDNAIWTDLSTTMTSGLSAATLSIQNTLAPNSKFKYFRVIGVGGVSYYAGASEVNLIVSNNYVQSQYTKPTCTGSDTDGDNLPNYLDLDSDGDGCSDALEAGTSSSTTTNFKFTGSNASFGANGFYNALEKTAAESNLYNGIYTYDYANNAGYNSCTDTDGDGVPDIIDLDNDNDGVLDAVESPTCFYTLDELYNPAAVSSELTQHTTSYVIGNSIDGVGTTASAFSTGQNWVGKSIFNFTAKNYIVITGMSFDLVSWALSSATASTFKLQGSGDNVNWIDLSTATYSTATTGTFTISNTLATTSKLKYYRLVGVAGTSGYGGVYEARFNLPAATSSSANPKSSCSNDTDGDGIFNQNDLDSDGDGCPDAVEAGTTAIATSGVLSSAKLTTSIIPGPYGANGFANGLETSSESGLYSGTYSYTFAKIASINACTDTDGDGVTDILDLDDDNDGVLDISELSCTAVATNATCLATPVAYGITTHCSGWNGYDYDPSPSVTVISNFDYMGLSSGVPYFDFQGSVPSSATSVIAGKMYKNYITVPGMTYTFSINLMSSFVDAEGIKPYLKGVDVATGTELGATYLNGSGTRSVTFTAIGTTTSITVGLDTRTSLAYTGPNQFWSESGMTMNGATYQICTMPDTDGDGIPNYLDLDSDGDGCPDAVEAGTTYISTSGVSSSAKLTTSVIPAPYGANGFANGLETSTESGKYTGTYTYIYANNASTNACLDSDGDGVPDVMDLDDDNDGVLDANEQINCITSGVDLNTLTFNGSSIIDKTANSFTTAGGDVWKSSYSNEILKLPISLKFKHNSTTGYMMFGLFPITKTQTPTSWTDGAYKFYQQVSGTYGYFQFPGGGWDFGPISFTTNDEFSINISSTGYVTAAINGVTQKAFQGEVTDYKLALSSYRASSLTNIILTDASRTAIFSCTELDSDTDGIPNRLDLDSDGDGCPDAVEAGVTALPSSGVLTSAKYSTSVIPAPYGNNGFANGLETTSESGVYTGTYTYNFATNASFNGCTDTDGDGVPDVLDLDDDNDGVLDIVECPIYVESNTCNNWIAPTNGVSGTIISATGETVGYTITANSGVSYRSLVGADFWTTTMQCGQPLPGSGRLSNFTGAAEFTITFDRPVSNAQLLTSATETGVNEGLIITTNASSQQTVSANCNSVNQSLVNNQVNQTTLVMTGDYGVIRTIKDASYTSLNVRATNNGGGLILALSLCSLKTRFTCDIDNDGIPNQLDLDSDGDGCPDAKEAGVNGTLSSGSVKNGSGGAVTSTTTIANAIAAGPYGANGLANGVETTTESGVVTYTSTYALNALVKDLVAPTIITQPLNKTVFVAGNAVLSVTAGSPPANRTLTYQWYKAGVAISGATSATYTVTISATTANADDYYCTLGFVNSCLTTNTNTVNVTVLTNPVGLTACQDASAVLSVTKTGTNVVTYQWKKAGVSLVNGANIAGVTTSSLTLTNLALADAGAYTLVATDANGAVITSLAGTITITNNTKYVLPTSYTTCATTSTINLSSAVLTGTSGATSTKWQRSLDGGNTWSDIVSSMDGVTYTNFTTATLGITAANTTASSSLNGYQYRIASINASCTNYSNVETLAVNSAPTITAQPSNSVLCNVFGTSFTAAANGANLTYKWQTRAPSGTWTTITALNANTIDVGVVYSNFATATLNLSAAPSTENNNEYQVVFTNSCGTVTSTTAILNPTVATPTITSGNFTVCEGTPITLTTSSSTASPTYQWYLAGTAIGGATGTTYNPTASGNYSVIANATGYCKSGTASSTVTINPAPLVAIAQGAVLTLPSGTGGIDLTATATPALSAPSAYNYTWYKAGTLVSGPASANVYSVSSAGSYTVRATNTSTNCFATSPATTITVLPSASVNGNSAICANGSVAMSVAIAAGQTIQWESSIDGSTWTPTGSTSATFNATPTNTTSAIISINYRAVIATGTNTSTAATGTTNAIVVNVNPIPTAIISNTASGTTLCAGTNAILTASSGAASPTYQWYNNNTIITGATSSTYTATSSGNYSFKVTDISCDCSATSISSTVTLVSPPAAPNLTATSKIICVNTTADLTVYQPLAITGVSYEWHSASNTLSTTLVANAAAVGTAGTYYLFAKNNSGGCYSTASVAFTLSIVSITQATLTGASSPTYTIGDIAVGLNASTSNPTYSLRWYTSSTGGVALTAPVIPSTATAGINNYYVEQYDASASFCTSSPRQLAAVTVKPLAPIVTGIAYCQNATAVALTATPAIGGALNWYGTAATGGTLTTTATIPATGTATNTTYYVSQTVNGVEGARAALTVTINALPIAPSTITGTFSVTSTNSYTYSVTSVANTTYQWTLPSFMSGKSTTSSISALVNAAGSGTINVIAINANGCLSPATTSSVISAAQYITPPPATTNVTYTIGDPAIPANTASRVIATTDATLNYYTSNVAGSTSTSAQSIPTTAGVYTYYVSQTINGIESVLVPYTVTIKPLQPTVANITYCQNDIALALTATGTDLQWYTVSTSGTATSTAPTPSTGTATSTTYYVTQTVNGVESDRIALVVTINPTPATPSLISGSATTSTQSSEIYSVTNDITATGYVWVLPNGWTGTSSVNSITATVGLSGGQIKVKAISGACASPFSTKTVDILNVTNPPLTTDITFVTGSTPSNIASNTSALITGTASTTINYYTSNAAGAASATSQTTPTTPGVYTYYVSQTSNIGVESILVPYTITVKPIAPPINTNNGIVGNTITYCKGVSAFALTATVSAGGTLKWYTVATGGASSNSAPTPSTSLVGTTNYYVSQVVNGVESDRVLIVVTVNDIPGAVTATATQPTCTNSSGYIVITSPLGTGFTYSVDGSNYTNTTLFSALPAGIYYATAKNDLGCVSAPSTVTINTAVAPPLSPLVSVVQPTCSITTGSISITSTTLSTDNFSIDGGLNYQASKIFTGVAPGTYTVTTLNAGGCVSTGTAAIVNAALPIPAKPSISSSSASANICAGTTVTLTSSAIIGNQWYKNGVLIAGAINQTYAPNASGNYTVIATNASGCTSLPSDAQTITFNPLPTPVISNGATLAFDNCTTTVITLTASNTNTSTGNTYQWYLNGNSINVGGNNSTYNANAAGEYSVVITNNGCSTTSAISKLIAAPSVNAANTAFCAGGSSLISGNSTGFVSPTYQWKISTDDGLNFVNATGAGTNSLTYTATTAGKYQLEVTASSIVSTSCPINVTVFTNPTATITVSPSAAVCVGSTISLNATVASGTASYTYQWLIAGGNDIAGAALSSYSTGVAGSYAVKVTDANGCVVNAAPSAISFNAVPTAPVVTITNPTCSVNTGSISVTSPLGLGYTYSIDGINYTNTTGLFTGLAVNTSYSVTVKSSTGCTSNATLASIAAALVVPAQPVITGPANVNPFSLNTYSVAPVTGATSYSWNIPGYWSGVSTTNTITIKVDASAGSFSVTANSANCVSIAATKIITATILNPDVNVTDINIAVSGKLTTNDIIPAGTTYGQPSTNGANPTGATITVNADGSYTFTATTPGKYTYYVPVCAVGQTTSCPVSPLEITVLDPLAVTDKPVANNDMASAKPGVPTTVNILANDAAGNAGGTLNTSSISISAAPKHGVVVVNSDGTITYTAAAGFIGTDSILYNVCDNSSPTPLCQTAVVYFTVVPTSAPATTIANDDYATVLASTDGTNAVSGNVLTNDKNSGGASLTATVVTGPTSAQGSFTMNANGSYTFTPTAGFSGPVDIIYTTCTGATPASCATATIHILVEPAQVLNPDAATAYINIPTTGNISTNDVIQPGSTYAQPAQQSGATITVNTDGTYSFTATDPGTYTYVITVCAIGQTTNCPTETLVITVPVNTLVDNAATAYINISTTGNISTNDVVPVGTSYGQPTQITGATITVNANGTYSFTSTAAGTYTYTVPVCAPGQTTGCPTETLVITVPVNTIVNDAASVNFSETLTSNLNTNDNVPVGTSYGTPIAGSSNPSITLPVINTNGTYTFTALEPGIYVFSVPVCAPGQTTNCPNETLTITVIDNRSTTTTHPPSVLVPDVNVTSINLPVKGNLSTNDSLQTGTTYGAATAATTNPTGGVITISPNGTYTFTATNPGKYIYYIPVCPAGQSIDCPISTLEITVFDPLLNTNNPVANNDIAATNAGTPVNVNILANDKSANNGIGLNKDSLKITIAPTNGTALINNDGTIKFIPAAGFIGTDSLTYKICDSAAPANCQVAMVYFTVNATGTAPITSAADDYASVASTANGTNSVSGNLLTNDVNTGTLTLTATLLNGPTAAQGSFTLTTDGKYTFTPAPGFSGPVDIIYQACDNASPAKCIAATLHILVTPATLITPDINVTAINVPVVGSLTTNDKIPAGSTYGTPTAASTNPAGAVIIISPNGTYTFTATVPGKYIYYVPVCANGQTTGCPLSPLEITVIDPFSNTNLPIVNNDVAATKVATPVTTNVLANDKKSNNNTQIDTASLKISTAPVHGTAIVNADGTITYTPAASFVGTDSLVYTVCDNAKPANCQTAVVYYTVLSTAANIVNALADDYATVNGAVKNTTSVSGNVLLNDKSTAGASLTASLVAGPTAAQGAFTINADGSYTFTPTAGFTGPISITYQACDNASPANCALATLHILVNPYFKLTNDSATQTIEKTINGNVTSNDYAPNATYGTPLPDTNNLTGASFILNTDGTYSFLAKLPGIYKYTYPVCGQGQITNCDSATILFNITYLPQGIINLKYPTLLKADSVHLVFNFTAGVGPFKLVILNSLTNRKDTLFNVRDSADIVVAPSKDDTKYTLLSIMDSNKVVRDFNITKDTANLNILKPQILLTLKADLPNKLPDNSFKTKILMKVKNNGEINLQDVQVNADLSKVFPADMRYRLDSFKVTYGKIKLNPNYTGLGATIKPSYVTKIENGFNVTYRSQSVLSGTDLFDYGVKLNISEEGDVVFYFTLNPGKTLDPLVLQFSSVGNGLLVQNDGKKSMDTTTSLSHDNSNLLTHPDLTGDGDALPTYIPLFLDAEIGAALQGSKADTVSEGYNFHYTSVIKNYSNSNLDSVFAYYNLRKAFPSPDTAFLIGIPKVTGTITLNSKYDGVTDTAILNGVGSLKVGDSILIKYDVFVKTKKAQYAWPSYLLTKGRTITGDILVSDSSTNGLNPDPNKDSIPKENLPTIVQVGYNPPLVPTLVSNVIYNVGDSLNPKNIGGLIKSVPLNAIPTWCDANGIICYTGVPSLPTKVGIYIYCVKSLDTLTGLSSSPCVMDTVTMLPVVKVKNDTLMSNITTNPKNIAYLIKSITPGSKPTWCDVNGNNCTKVAPSIPNIPGKYIWCVKAVDSATNLTSANCTMDTLVVLDPYNVLDISKQVTGISMNPDGSYLINFVIKAQNKTIYKIDSVFIKDDLATTFKTNKGFDIVNMTVSGALVKNNSYNGYTNIDLVTNASVLAANKMDSVNLTLLIHSADINGKYENIASIIANTNYGKLGLVSNDPVLNPSNYLNRVPTAFVVPTMDVLIPGGFSPNNDGIDDAWIIKRPFGTKIIVHVFNRWGNVVYENENYNNDWKGKGISNFLGEDVPEGTYFYAVEATDNNGGIKKLAGSLTIVR